MAKQAKSITFKNAQIDAENGIIIECLKDEDKTYLLKDIFRDWDGITGITLTLKQADTLPSLEDRQDDGDFGEGEGADDDFEDGSEQTSMED